MRRIGAFFAVVATAISLAACGSSGKGPVTLNWDVFPEPSGSFAKAELSAAQVNDPRSMLALKLDGADLSRDHGYPARTIVPAAPGVHNTKWVNKIIFQESA